MEADLGGTQIREGIGGLGGHPCNVPSGNRVFGIFLQDAILQTEISDFGLKMELIGNNFSLGVSYF